MVASPDIYGTDVLLSDAGDFSVTPAGQLALISGPMNPAQALVNRLRTAPGELPLHPDYGNALARSVVGTKTNDPTLVVSHVNTELRNVMEADQRFLKAENIVATQDPADPSRTGVYVELVLAGGDRLTTVDVTDTPSITDFQASPSLVDQLSEQELDDAFGANPDASADQVPDLDEQLEGVLDAATTGTGFTVAFGEPI